eukprot:GFUD01000544.1.p1 GENE.GFUD01000544.1~~GFUD01000544.1.p1  ORF type:complete len:280 (-),score=59.65 GFUD01000544.1:239-1078(-)
MISHKYSPIPDSDPEQSGVNTQTTARGKMVTLATRIQVSKPVKLLGVIAFLFLVWILYNYRIIENENVMNEGDFGSANKKENVVTTPKPDLKVVKVDVYYECLCPDSRYFVLHELLPTFEKVGSMMDIHLWPYGKATTTVTEKGYEFSCQHGEQECIGNIYHACVEKIVEDMTKKLELIKCMISDNYEPENIAKKCASEGGIDFEEIQTCASGQEGKELHFKAGQKTEALHPKVSFIPTIEIDDDQNSQKAILKNLLKEVCASYSTQYLTHNEKLANCP